MRYNFYFSETTLQSDIEKVLKNDIAFYHGPQELVWICGNLDSGCVEVYSSFLQSKSDVIFSPLIGNLIDIISENNPEQVNVHNIRYISIKNSEIFCACFIWDWEPEINKLW